MNAVDDRVHGDQRTFRALLAALAHPGRVMALDEPVEAPGDLGSALAASALALFDREVGVWIAPAQRAQIGRWLIARTGCRLVAEPADAQFAVIFDPDDALPFDRWNCGTPEDPEGSVTLLVRVAAFTGDRTLTFTGPGIEHHVTLAMHGIPARFWLEWSTNTSLYPLGVDCFFFDERSVAGLPRTAKEQRA